MTNKYIGAIEISLTESKILGGDEACECHSLDRKMHLYLGKLATCYTPGNRPDCLG